uniref:Astakine n=1 Tax=Pacifastacus leniusculus TaxID=6720 RepID=ASTA_PACLE|nr:RecName: Full=Astakine; AltName: Full=Prokineticin-like cytokine; Flags: Precursor [Pacifastacus leniusculus]AAX14635.1 astakine [Pacifastacus leniusculus]
MKMRGVSVGVLVVAMMSGLAMAGSCNSQEPDCGPSECCLQGWMRYSTRGCAPLGEAGSSCNVFTQAPVKGFYIGMCPCRAGLVCTRPSATCQLPSQDNTLDSYY